MSLDVSLYLLNEKGIEEEVFEQNITHNLGTMAGEAGIYEYLWHPEKINITKASQLIEPLEKALIEMALNPSKYKEHDASNGWGKYRDFLPWLADYLEACKKYPDATVRADR